MFNSNSSQKQKTSRNKQNKPKNKLDVDSLRENHKEFIENNRLVLKSQQRFWSEKHAFTGEVKKLHWVLVMIKEYNQQIQ